MKTLRIIFTCGALALMGLSGMPGEEPSRKKKNSAAKAAVAAPRPPMGWNSFDAYDCRINEAEFKANVDYLAQNLKPYGWEYAVMDYIWFNDTPGNWNNPKRRHGHPDIRLGEDGRPIDQLVMDKNGRLWPSEKRFPSAVGGKGFKPIADYVHSKGLKFGLHIMRGIPRQAFYQNCPIKGASASAKDIAEPWDTCNWCNNMYGIDPTKPGSQEYYDSLFELYAAWGVDFIKADDMMFPAYHKGEIEMMRKAIDKCGRPIVLSLSCGEAPVSQAAHLLQNANMWRISADFWDRWDALEHNFDLLNAWSPHIKENHWPDADMLPMGKLSLENRPHGPERMSKFTPDEQQTMMTLWCMARSPLMMGGDLLTLPTDVKQLLTNDEVLAINRSSTDNRQIINHNKKAIWIATDPATQDRYVALFNLSDKPTEVTFDFELEYLRGTYFVRDLWEKKDVGPTQKKIQMQIPAHGARLVKLSKKA
jgi:alpha-galactosidase